MGVQGPAALPIVVAAPVDRRPGKGEFLSKVLACMAVAQELTLLDDHTEQLDRRVSRILADALGQAQCGPAGLIVQDQLLETLALDEVEDAGARNQIDSALAREVIS